MQGFMMVNGQLEAVEHVCPRCHKWKEWNHEFCADCTTALLSNAPVDLPDEDGCGPEYPDEPILEAQRDIFDLLTAIQYAVDAANDGHAMEGLDAAMKTAERIAADWGFTLPETAAE